MTEDRLQCISLLIRVQLTNTQTQIHSYSTCRFTDVFYKFLFYGSKSIKYTICHFDWIWWLSKIKILPDMAKNLVPLRRWDSWPTNNKVPSPRLLRYRVKKIWLIFLFFHVAVKSVTTKKSINFFFTLTQKAWHPKKFNSFFHID